MQRNIGMDVLVNPWGTQMIRRCASALIKLVDEEADRQVDRQAGTHTARPQYCSPPWPSASRGREGSQQRGTLLRRTWLHFGVSLLET